jgi:hypothetical protein
LLGHYLPRWGANTAYVVYSNVKNGSSQNTFAAYDKQNNLLSIYNPRGDYAGVISPNHNWLRAVGNGIVLYEASSGHLYRYSAASSGLISQGVDSQRESDYVITGLVVTSDGSIFASKRPVHPENPAGPGGLFALTNVASKGLAKWERVSQSSPLRSHFTLLGADGKAIVYRSWAKRIDWSRLTVSGQE